MKAVFVDRDGVINRNRGSHVKSWKEFDFLPHVVEALAELTRHGFRTVVLTNQAAINRGIISRETVEEIHARMVAVLEAAGARIDGVFYCPHRPEEGCGCRKPEPGLLFQAADRLKLDLPGSYLIGDALTDLLAGMAAGCRPILVLTGRGFPQFLSPGARRVTHYHVSRDLRHAVRRILVAEGLVKPSILERARSRLEGMVA
ncbi:MAG: D-glycero-beta-D-manno-heptose 1,7-bisphosphate 7-phosphatase [Sphingomonadaceae bacterium]